MVVTDSPKTKEALLQSNSWVDVRDVALGHVLALEKEAAGGERIINTAGTSLLGAIKFGTPIYLPYYVSRWLYMARVAYVCPLTFVP